MGDLYNYLYSLDPETRKEQLAMLQQAIELLANIHDVKNRIPR